VTSSAESVVVVARWQTAEGYLDDVLALVAELRQRSLEEPGCVGYEVLQSADEPVTVFLLERYRDGAALEEHRNTDHYRTLVVERILPMLMTRRVELLRPRDSIST
jgi:quinol monooxygenase YgiN